MSQRFQVLTGTSAETVMELSSLARAGFAEGTLGEVLNRIGDSTGETWLHLLGLCLELDAPATVDQLISQVEEMRPLHFREVLLGSTAWSWRSIVGAETIKAAARGDERAQKRLLEDDRYYGGSAAASLHKVIGLDAEETRQVFIDALTAFADTRDLGALEDDLGSAKRQVRNLAASQGWVEAIETLTGYRYFPEPEARSVALVPHLAEESLSLVQHDETRLIAFGVRPPSDFESRTLDIARALSDETRIRILSSLRTGPKQLGDLLESSGLTRSTVHHHLRTLRRAGLVLVEGNAHNYRYALNETGRLSALVAIGKLLDLDEEGDK